MAPTKPKEPAASSKSGSAGKSGTPFNSDVELADPAAHPIATAASRKSESASNEDATMSLFSGPAFSGAAQQEVRQLADKLLDLNSQFAEEISCACERRLLDHNVQQPIAKDVRTFLSKYKGTDHAEFVELLSKLVQSVPSDNFVENSKTCGRTVRSVNVRDLVENLRSDVNDSLVEMVDCIVRELKLPVEQRCPLDQKKTSFLARNNAALDSLESDLREKLEKEVHPIQFEVGRETLESDSNFFGFAGEQEILQERDQLKAKVESLQDDLDKCEQYADNVVRDASRRLEFLEKAAKLVKCEEQELVARIANLMKCNLQAKAKSRTNELKIQEFEDKLTHANADILQDSKQRIDHLEQQLQALTTEVTTVRTENKELQDLVNAFKNLDSKESSGTRHSLKDFVKAFWLCQDMQGRLQRCTQPIAHHRFSSYVPYTCRTRYS